MKTRTVSKLVSKLLVVIGVVVIVMLAVLGLFFTSFNDHTYIATVTAKERIVTTDNGNIKSYYLVFGKDEAGNYYEFKNEDVFIRGKFHSSTFQNQLEIGQTYQFTVVGFRIGLFSWYENIINFEKV